MQVLVCDVQKCILQQYAQPYAPWWGIACKQWQLESSIVPEPDHAHNRQCEVLASEGRLGFLQRILDETGNRLYDKTALFDDWKKRRLMEEAAKEGHVELLRWLGGQWHVTAGMWEIIMMKAARNNHEHVVRLCYELFASATRMDTKRMEFAMAGAARGGHERLMQLCFKEWVASSTPAGWKLQHAVGSAMQEAARGGHESIVRLCHAWAIANLENTLAGLNVNDVRGAVRTCMLSYVSDICGTLCCAARGGHAHIIDVCYQWLASNIHRATAYASRTGDLDIVKQCKESHTNGVAEVAMREAAKGGHEHVVRLCHDQYGAMDVDETMAQAAWGGHERIVRICHDEWKATNVNRAMAMAAGGGHENIVRLCHDEYNATNITDAMRWAATEGRDHIVQLCYEWGARCIPEALNQSCEKDHITTVKRGPRVSVAERCDNKGCGIVRGRERVVTLCKHWLLLQTGRL